MRGSKHDLPVAFEAGGMTSRQVEWGEMNVSYESGPAGLDPSPFFKGLPDDRCQCPHWGYLVKGRMRIKYADREEIINAGDVYYLTPGHIALSEEDIELVEFSPKGEYQKTLEVAFRNYQAMQQNQAVAE
jgi:hypothetical protein